MGTIATLLHFIMKEIEAWENKELVQCLTMKSRAKLYLRSIRRYRIVY